MILFCCAMLGLGAGVALSGIIAENALITFFGGFMLFTFLGGLIVNLKKKDRGDPA